MRNRFSGAGLCSDRHRIWEYLSGQRRGQLLARRRRRIDQCARAERQRTFQDTVVPYGPDEPTPVTTTHHRTVRHTRSVPEDRSSIEPAQGHLKLIKNSYAYERPTSSSTRIEPVEAGKFVNVIGTSHYYAQVKLKNSEIAYVPLTSIALVNPTDKMFKLTADAPVLSAPTHSASKIAEVHRGRDVHAIGIALSFVKIRMKDGKEGYIPIHALE